MDISLKRDGLTLRGTLVKPDNVEKCPITVIFHGLMGDRAANRVNMHSMLAEKLLARGIASVRFDFSGHGESDGDFSDMSVLGEILDAHVIMQYVRSLDWVTDIYIFGHSQGGLVGGMTAGYFRECVSKLVMFAPAATIPDDALRGYAFGNVYDCVYPPENIHMVDITGKDYYLGQTYMRTARTLPVYETTSMFTGKTLIIHGTADEAVGTIATDRYAKCLKNVTVDFRRGDNHGLDAISLDEVVEKAALFLAEE